MLLITFGLSVHAQTNHYEDHNEYPIIVKRFCFISQGNSYPLTVEICPYGFWFLGDVYYGHSQEPLKEYLKQMCFSWKVNGLMVITPRSYYYDTLTVDTILTKFNTGLCNQNYPGFVINNPDYPDLINLSDSGSFKEFIKEFGYTYILRNIVFDDENFEIIRVIYPTNSFPYKTSFDLVTLKLLPNGIQMTSTSIETINLLNIQIKENGTALLKTKDYKRLIKRITKTTFNKSIASDQCNDAPYDQNEFIVDYRKGDVHNSYFLCDYLSAEDKNQQKIINYLIGLKSTVAFLNEKYFY